MLFNGTIKQLSEIVKVDSQIIQSVVKYLEIKGKAVQKGKIKSPSGRGRDAVVWEIETPISIFNECCGDSN